MTTSPSASRRGFLLLLGLSAAAALGACTEPGEGQTTSSSPRPPGPTGARVPSELEQALLPWYLDTVTAGAHLRAAPKSVTTARWHEVTTGQQARLKEALLDAGAPVASLPPAPVVRSTSLAGAATVLSRRATPEAVRDALEAPLESRGALLVLVATRAAAAHNLSGRRPLLDASGLTVESARALLPELQTARYVVQVAAAAASPAERKLWLTPLDQLGDLVSDLQAQVPDDAPPPLAQPLAGEVRTRAERSARVREAGQAWMVAYATELSRSTERPVAEVVPLVDGMTRAVLAAIGLGTALSPFPGLRSP